MAEEFTANEGQDFNPGALAVADNAPTLLLEDTDVGYHYVARRQGPAAPDGSATHSVRITPVMLPFCRVIPAPAYQFFVFEVPQTDHLTATFIIVHGPRPVDRQQIIHIMGLDDPRFWNETDCNFRATWADGMNQDRAAMDTNWTGFSGIEQEDAVLAVSMGTILDRTKEHMVAADRAVIHLRVRLLESVRCHEEGGVPIGLKPADDDRRRRAVAGPRAGQHGPVHARGRTVIACVVASTTEIADRIRLVELAAADGGLPGFEAGDHIDVGLGQGRREGGARSRPGQRVEVGSPTWKTSAGAVGAPCWRATRIAAARAPEPCSGPRRSPSGGRLGDHGRPHHIALARATPYGPHRSSSSKAGAIAAGRTEEHRDSVLSRTERAGHTMMLICCSRATGGRLVLDL